jgi:hypothetical protein
VGLVYFVFICVILSFNFAINSLIDFHEEECPLPQISKILLLYCRDCEHFMEMMITFREMLKEMAECEVRTCLLLA